jgi:hypothetical protein
MRVSLLTRASAAVVLATLLLATLPGAFAGGKDKEKDKDPAAAKPRITYSIGPGGQFALQLIDAKGRQVPINFEERGIGNTIVFVSVDDEKYVFGAPADGKFPPGYQGGKFEAKPAPLPGGRLGHALVWTAGGKLRVKQIIEIVKSRSGTLDTCVLRYEIGNLDKRAHKIGMRVLVDTLIGDNDGHPFQLPGQKKLITTSADLRGKAVPEYVKALEKPSADNPGTVAYFTLRPGGALVGPDRISLTRFPTEKTIKEDLVKWDLPVRNIKLDAGDPGDSAVVMYWNPHEVRGGGQIGYGFAYGGGIVALGKAEKKGRD